MNNKDSEKENKGEKGLSNIITYVPNNPWKRIKIKIFDSIRKDPQKFFKKKKPLSEEERLLLEQYLSIDIICETVSYAELLGAYLLAFLKKDPIIQKTLLNYQIPDIISLFETMRNKNIEEIANMIGYPSLSDFGPSMGKQKEFIDDFKQSLINVKHELEKIAEFYLAHREFYNDYKHGFRLFPTTSSLPDSDTFSVTFQIKKGKVLNKIVVYPMEKDAEKALKISKRIAQILYVIIPVFRERFIENNDTISLRLFGISKNRKYRKDNKISS